jgi:hypothetical protein
MIKTNKTALDAVYEKVEITFASRIQQPVRLTRIDFTALKAWSETWEPINKREPPNGGWDWFKYGDTSYDWMDQERDGKDVKTGTDFKENNFVAKGPSLGVGYNLPLWKGMLSLSIAAALLDGKITTNRNHQQGDSSDVKLVNRTRKEQVIANAMGVTLDVNWSQPITERLFYSILLQGFEYNFDANRGVFRDSLISDRNHEILNIDAFDVEETLYSINLSLSYRF